MKEFEKVLQVASGEIGYLEKASNAQLDDKTANVGLNNYTKYARDMDNFNVYNGKKNGYPWCNVFVDWCFVQALGVERTRELLIGFSAGCTQDYNWLKAKGQIVSNPEAGDLVFFGQLSHIGIVEKVEDGRIYTIEGNTSNTAELIVNGGTVARKSYALNSQYIHSYARLKYSDEDKGTIENKPNDNQSNEITYPLILKGSKGNFVRIAQGKLIAKGYRLAKFGADGDFGAETETVVKQLQSDAGLEVDGKIGTNTWAVLNGDFVKPTSSYPEYLIKKNQQSEDVRKVQARLIELGYSCGKSGADSIFGNGTHDAVVTFQKAKGLAVDGKVGINTWNALFN